MVSPVQIRAIDGPVGKIELRIDVPTDDPRGHVIVAHPHPSQGGAEHQVPEHLATSLRDRGWLAVRPSFRGADGTEGQHDQGIGESDDLVTVAKWLAEEFPGKPLALAGFSFGAYVQAMVARKLVQDGRPVLAVALAGLATGDVPGGQHYEAGAVPEGTLIIHGEHDERVPLESVLRWADAQGRPVTVLPGADHFFSRKLTLLTRCVAHHLEFELLRQQAPT